VDISLPPSLVKRSCSFSRKAQIIIYIVVCIDDVFLVRPILRQSMLTNAEHIIESGMITQIVPNKLWTAIFLYKCNL
jgi:hydrogenase-4 membrane subunit HyfE